MTAPAPAQEAAATKVALATEDLARRFGGLSAVNGLTLSVPEGELRCIIGPNGAGKTTFFNLVTGLIAPTRGRIFFGGQDITGLRPHQIARLGVMRLFQTATLFDSFTVAENVRLGIQRCSETFNPFRRVSRLPGMKRVDDILKTVGLKERRAARARALAHGERKRLELAMILAAEPKLLLLDEPTAGMTIHETAEIVEVIKAASVGITTLVVEHDIDFVRAIADYVTVLHRGAVLAEGTIAEVVANEQVREVYLGGVD